MTRCFVTFEEYGKWVPARIGSDEDQVRLMLTGSEPQRMPLVGMVVSLSLSYDAWYRRSPVGRYLIHSVLFYDGTRWDAVDGWFGQCMTKTEVWKLRFRWWCGLGGRVVSYILKVGE